ncbi:MAG: hypothetical protein ACFE8M_12450 [Candidatus Hermodarchaeota archaeon]
MEETKSNIPLNDLRNRISSNLKGISERSRNYIKDVVSLINKEIGVNKILSIMLFGSQRSEKKQESTLISDCDLLFIFKNRVSNRHIREIEKYFIALEMKHKFKPPNSSLLNNILGVIQYSTGMFVSHFLTKQKFWEQANFPKIFHVNKVFSALFAPRNIVLSNVIDNCTILYGDDLRDNIRPRIKISIREMIKSTVMNLFISFFALIILPLKKTNSIKYQLEALKWTLRTSNYYCFEDTETLINIINRFISLDSYASQLKSKQFFNKFLQLRKNPQKILIFMLRSPIRIIKIHVKAIVYKKLVKRNLIKVPIKHRDDIIPGRTFPIQF